MKLKSLFCLIAVIAILTIPAIPAQAQIRDTVKQSINMGYFIDLYGVIGQTAIPTIGGAPLVVSDTVASIIPISGLNQIDALLSWYWQKVGSGSATITVAFFQGNDQFNFNALTAGVANATYTKTFSALAASGWHYIDFRADSVKFSGRYLKVSFTTSSTASVNGNVWARLKTSIR